MKLLVAILIILVPSVAWAQIDQAEIDYKGTHGVFLSEEKFTSILIDLEDYKATESHIKLLEEKLKLKDESMEIYRLQLKLSDEISDKYKESLASLDKLRTAEVKRCEKKLEEQDAWYRSNYLWFSVGFIAASAMAVGLAYGLNSSETVGN